MPKPTDRTLSDMWNSYAQLVIPAGMSPAHIEHTKFAFYGGAAYVLETLVAMSEPGVSEEAGVEIIVRLRKELERFAEEHSGRVKPGN